MSALSVILLVLSVAMILAVVIALVRCWFGCESTPPPVRYPRAEGAVMRPTRENIRLQYYSYDDGPEKRREWIENEPRWHEDRHAWLDPRGVTVRARE